MVSCLHLNLVEGFIATWEQLTRGVTGSCGLRFLESALLAAKFDVCLVGLVGNLLALGLSALHWCSHFADEGLLVLGFVVVATLAM